MKNINIATTDNAPSSGSRKTWTKPELEDLDCGLDEVNFNPGPGADGGGTLGRSAS